MTPEATPAECFVCRKHRERGTLVPGGAEPQIADPVRDLRRYLATLTGEGDC
jgi:hypothetical protein